MHRALSVVLRFDGGAPLAARQQHAGSEVGGGGGDKLVRGAAPHVTAYDVYREELRHALRTAVCEWARAQYDAAERECELRADVVCRFQERLARPWRSADHSEIAQLIDDNYAGGAGGGAGGGVAQYVAVLTRALGALTHVLAFADGDVAAHLEQLAVLGARLRGFRIHTQVTPAAFAAKVARAAARYFRDEAPFAFCTDARARDYVAARRSALAAIDALIDSTLRTCAIAVVPQLDEALRERVEAERERRRRHRTAATRSPQPAQSLSVARRAPPQQPRRASGSDHNRRRHASAGGDADERALSRSFSSSVSVAAAPAAAGVANARNERQRTARLATALGNGHIGDDSFLRELYGEARSRIDEDAGRNNAPAPVRQWPSPPPPRTTAPVASPVPAAAAAAVPARSSSPPTSSRADRAAPVSVVLQASGGGQKSASVPAANADAHADADANAAVDPLDGAKRDEPGVARSASRSVASKPHAVAAAR